MKGTPPSGRDEMYENPILKNGRHNCFFRMLLIRFCRAQTLARSNKELKYERRGRILGNIWKKKAEIISIQELQPAVGLRFECVFEATPS